MRRCADNFDVDAKCPYYRRVSIDNALYCINCEGVSSTSGCKMWFRRAEEREKHFDTYCAADHQDGCPIADGQEKRYEDGKV